ncbi:MAG: GspMb/PilO family protein [Caulobacterales bacterium]
MTDETHFASLETKERTTVGWVGPSRAGLVFVAVVWAGVLSLSIWLAHPPDASARLSHLKRVVGQAELDAPKPTAPWEDPAAICNGTIDDVDGAMRSVLDTAGLARSHVDVRAEPPGDHPGFERFTVEIVAEGAYPGIIRALVALDDARPTIFVRRVTLRTMPEGVALGIDGSVLCRGNSGAAP